MNTYWLKKLRDEADRIYHLRLNTSGTYDIYFHNYKVVKLCTVPSRQQAFELLNKYKKEHILKKVKLLKKNR